MVYFHNRPHFIITLRCAVQLLMGGAILNYTLILQWITEGLDVVDDTALQKEPNLSQDNYIRRVTFELDTTYCATCL